MLDLTMRYMKIETKLCKAIGLSTSTFDRNILSVHVFLQNLCSLLNYQIICENFFLFDLIRN